MSTLFARISYAQEQFGARLQDWQRYRQHCTIKLKKSKGLADQALWKAERSWAAFQEIKHSFVKGAPPTLKRQKRALRRLQRAVDSTEKYLSTFDSVNSLEKAEASSWNAWMAALMASEKHDWQVAYHLFQKSKAICEQMYRQTGNELYSKRIQNDLDGNLKFINYNLTKNGMEPKIQENFNISTFEIPQRSTQICRAPFDFSVKYKPKTIDRLLEEGQICEEGITFLKALKLYNYHSKSGDLKALVSAFRLIEALSEPGVDKLRNQIARAYFKGARKEERISTALDQKLNLCEKYQMVPVEGKPVFFDMASSYLTRK
jgi:hypothetical protein